MSESRHIDGKYSKKGGQITSFLVVQLLWVCDAFSSVWKSQKCQIRHQAKKSSKDEMRGRDFPFTVSFRLKLNGEFIIISYSLPIQLYQLLLEEKRERQMEVFKTEDFTYYSLKSVKA